MGIFSYKRIFSGSRTPAFGLSPNLALAAAPNGGLTTTSTSTGSGSDTGNGSFNPPSSSLEVHVLNRTSFGIRPEDLDEIRQIGIEAYLERQLNPASIDDSEMEAVLAERFPSLGMSPAEIQQYMASEDINQIQIAVQLKAATFYRAVKSKRQLFEVMVEFWTNHFNLFHLDGPIAVLKTADDRDVIRANALGNFTDLLHASTKSPAMIQYLDTYASTKESPNENYARELMELHTLGVDGPYTHEDIDAISRCFTGWTIGRFNNRGEFIFRQENHDEEEKTVLGVNIAANGGLSDGEQVVEILARNQSTANFLARKLITRFVSDVPNEALTETLTTTYMETSGDIKQILKSLFDSDAFLQSFDAKIKRPFHYCTSIFRSLDITPERASERSIRDALNAMGQVPFNWLPPDGYPDTAEYWTSTNGLLNRWNLSMNIAFDDLRGVELDLAKLVTSTSSAEVIVDQLTELTCHRELLSQDRDALITYLQGSGQTEQITLDQGRGVLALLLSSPYFQWR